MSEFIYIVFSGEKYQGGFISGVFKTYEMALAEVEATVTGSKYFPYSRTDFNMWESGCDYMSIQKWDLKTGLNINLTKDSPEILAENAK